MIFLLPLALGLTLLDPIAQSEKYHHFADARSFMGIANFFDVFSNLGFLIVGSMGLFAGIKRRLGLSWNIFFSSVALVFFGSSYYHLSPNTDSLFWDRLPMTLAFCSLLSAVVTKTFSLKNEPMVLLGFLLVGLYSLIHWQLFDDLRVYFWIQLSPMLALLYLTFIFDNKVIPKNYLIMAFLSYLAAKIVEILDAQIFSITFDQISGHSLKHLLAALAVFWLVKASQKQFEVVRQNTSETIR